MADLGGVDAAYARLLASWNRGANIIFYAGHGNSTKWAPRSRGKRLFGAADVAGLAEQAVTPLVIQLDCFSSSAHMNSARSMGEVMIVTPKRGAFAVVGSVGRTAPHGQMALAEAMLRDFKANGSTVGEALLKAQKEVAAYDGVLKSFALFGDPASK